MLKKNRHQIIWKRSDEGLEMIIPKVIKSDINYQLMFGPEEDKEEERRRIKKHHERENIKVVSLEEIKIRYI